MRIDKRTESILIMKLLNSSLVSNNINIWPNGGWGATSLLVTVKE